MLSQPEDVFLDAKGLSRAAPFGCLGAQATDIGIQDIPRAFKDETVNGELQEIHFFGTQIRLNPIDQHGHHVHVTGTKTILDIVVSQPWLLDGGFYREEVPEQGLEVGAKPFTERDIDMVIVDAAGEARNIEQHRFRCAQF